MQSESDKGDTVCESKELPYCYARIEMKARKLQAKHFVESATTWITKMMLAREESNDEANASPDSSCINKPTLIYPAMDLREEVS
mmetsp:Transcript_92081/g.144522  ORF Transcript_92081/g.144522 Transcript_92081/m.144522 type:complete len:85 (+) Transcript_92081:203-457(+)